jgi:hypothetical protein
MLQRVIGVDGRAARFTAVGFYPPASHNALLSAGWFENDPVTCSKSRYVGVRVSRLEAISADSILVLAQSAAGFR